MGGGYKIAVLRMITTIKMILVKMILKEFMWKYKLKNKTEIEGMLWFQSTVGIYSLLHILEVSECREISLV